MPNFNQVTLMGNLVRDPELRYTPKGLAIAKIGMAVNRRWKTEGGEEKEEVTFVDIDAFGRQAETIGQYCKKGHPLFVQGRLKLDQWDDKQTGQKRSRLGIVLEQFQFLNGGKGREGGESAPASRSAPRPPPAASDSDQPPQGGDDVPF